MSPGGGKVERRVWDRERGWFGKRKGVVRVLELGCAGMGAGIGTGGSGWDRGVRGVAGIVGLGRGRVQRASNQYASSR